MFGNCKTWMDIQTLYMYTYCKDVCIYIKYHICILPNCHSATKTKSRDDIVLTSLLFVVLTSLSACMQLHWWAVLVYFGRPNARH